MYGRKWAVCDNRRCLRLNQEATLVRPRSQTCTRKKSCSLCDGLLPVWSTTAFWIPAKPLHLRSMLSDSISCTKNCNACSRHWSTERAQFSTATPNRTLHNQHVESWTNWATKFCLICHIHLTFLPVNYHFFKHVNNFLQGKCFDSQQETENAFQEFIESHSTDFYTMGINKHISHGQKCVDCNSSSVD